MVFFSHLARRMSRGVSRVQMGMEMGMTAQAILESGWVVPVFFATGEHRSSS
jgi:hypothetical protein